MTDKEKEKLDDIRRLLNFIEEKDLPVPLYTPTFMAGVTTRTELVKLAKRLGSFTKEYSDAPGSFCVKKRFGSVAYELVIAREQVCERVKTGEQRVIPATPATPEVVVDVYAWHCPDTLFAEDENDKEAVGIVSSSV